MRERWGAMLAWALLFGCSSDDGGDQSFAVKWSFASGDCAANQIAKIRAVYTPPGGAQATKEAECAAGTMELGALSSGTQTWAFTLEGLDAAGAVRVTSGPVTSTLSRSGDITVPPHDVVLRPKSSDVVVTWNGCPTGFILPYVVTLYRPPASGAALTDKVTSTQESCQARTATLTGIAPGSYVVEVDSRAQNPKILGTSPVTVVAGERAEVHVAVPVR